MDDGMVKELMATVTCAVCGRRYEAGNINVLYHQRELWFVSVVCQACNTKSLVAALIKEGSGPQVVTDLTDEEMARFMDASPVSADDILDLHAFLEEFDGDFAGIFEKKQPQG